MSTRIAEVQVARVLQLINNNSSRPVVVVTSDDGNEIKNSEEVHGLGIKVVQDRHADEQLQQHGLHRVFSTPPPTLPSYGFSVNSILGAASSATVSDQHGQPSQPHFTNTYHYRSNDMVGLNIGCSQQHDITPVTDLPTNSIASLHRPEATSRLQMVRPFWVKERANDTEEVDNGSQRVISSSSTELVALQPVLTHDVGGDSNVQNVVALANGKELAFDMAPNVAAAELEGIGVASAPYDGDRFVYRAMQGTVGMMPEGQEWMMPTTGHPLARYYGQQQLDPLGTYVLDHYGHLPMGSYDDRQYLQPDMLYNEFRQHHHQQQHQHHYSPHNSDLVDHPYMDNDLYSKHDSNNNHPNEIYFAERVPQQRYAAASRSFQPSSDLTSRDPQSDNKPVSVENPSTDSDHAVHQKTSVNGSENLTPPPQQTLSTAMSGTVSSASSTTSSKKKRRVLFSKEQITDLENYFRRHSYLSSVERDQLAAALQLTPTQIKIWFQNHRYKLKKMRQDESTTATSSPSPSNGRHVPSRHNYHRLHPQHHQQQHNSPANTTNEQRHHPTSILTGVSTPTTTVLNGWSMPSDSPSTTTFHTFQNRPYEVSVSVVPSSSSSSSTLFSYPASRFVSIPHPPQSDVVNGSLYQIGGYGSDEVAVITTDIIQPPMMSSFAGSRAGFLSSQQDGISIESAAKLLLMQHR